MARFAGTRAPQIQIAKNIGSSGQMEAPMPISVDGGTSNAGDAASAVSVGQIFNAYREKSPKYDQIANTAQTIRANEQIAGMSAEATIASAGLNALADVKAAEAQADAMKAAGSAARKGGMMSGLGSIAGAALGLFSDETTEETTERIDDALATLRELKPVTFNYTEEFSCNPERLHYGFIAQEYREVMPDATYRDESTGKLCIDPIELIGLLVRANQQLETRITRLEAKLVLETV